MYWLRNGDAPNKVSFKALRAKKDCEDVSALRLADGNITNDDETIREMFKESLSSIVGTPLDTGGS